jgi:hypothetical protein
MIVIPSHGVLRSERIPGRGGRFEFRAGSSALRSTVTRGVVYVGTNNCTYTLARSPSLIPASRRAKVVFP